MQDSAERIVATYRRQGWYPVKWSHHPAPVKEALRAMGYRPRLKECYGNSQRLFLSGFVNDLEYVEGHVLSIIPVQHAWLLYRGEILDLTLQDAQYFPIAVKYTKDQLRRSMMRKQVFSLVSEAANYFTNPFNVQRELLGSADLQGGDDALGGGVLKPRREVLRRLMLEEDGLTEEQVVALFEQFDAAVRKEAA